MFQRVGKRDRCGVCGIVSNIVMWCCVGVLTGQVNGAENPEPALTHDQILIALPVYVTSIIMTAIFTWTIAQYDRKRDRKLDSIQHMNDELKREMDILQEQIKHRNKT